MEDLFRSIKSKHQLAGYVNLYLKDKDANLESTIQEIPHKEYDSFAKLVAEFVRDIAECAQKESEQPEEGEARDAGVLDRAKAIATVIHLFIKNDQAAVPAPIYESIQTLHALLFALGDLYPESTKVLAIQSLIAEICERWYLQDRDGKEGVVAHTLLFLLIKTNQTGAQLADLKRLYEFRTALTLINYEEANCATLIELMQKSAASSFYLGHDAGKKLLAYMFTLHPALVERLHEAVKYQLSHAKAHITTAYAEIYYQAWRLSSGHIRVTIEDACIQDFIQHSIRVKNPALLKSLQFILRHFSEKRINKRHIDTMLARLYEPILWRALKNANPHVRKNAVAQFAISFPLISDEWATEEVESAVQKQCGHILQLLDDPIPFVRVEAVHLVGHILSLFVDFLPQRQTQFFLNVLAQRMAHDKASAEVRAAVVRALTRICGAQHITHVLMKDLLPELSNLIHDDSEKVRLAMVELLDTVKQIKNLKFYRIVSVENLLLRLSVEKNAKIIKNISSLLMKSYFPTGKKNTRELIVRGIACIKTNAKGALVFYENIATHVSPGTVVKFMIACWKCIQDWVLNRKAAAELELTEFDEETESEYGLKIDDLDAICTLFRLIPLLWRAISGFLQHEDNVALVEHLNAKLDDPSFVAMHAYFVAPALSQSEEEPQEAALFPTEAALTVQRALLETAGHLSALASFSQIALAALNPGTESETLESLVKALYGWNSEEVTKMILDMVSSPLTINAKRLKEQEIQDIFDNGRFGFRLLDMILKAPSLRLMILASEEAVSAILQALHQYQTLAQTRLAPEGSAEHQRVPDQLLLGAIDLKHRLLLHIAFCSCSDAEALSGIGASLEELLDWNVEHIWPHFSSQEDEARSPSKKRQWEDDETMPTEEMAERISHITLAIVSDFSLFGYASEALNLRLLGLALALVSAESGYALTDAFKETVVAISLKTIYHLYHARRDGEDVARQSTTLIEGIFQAVGVESLKKSFLLNELLQLSSKRSNLKPLVEVVCAIVVDAVPTGEAEEDNNRLFCYIEEVSALAGWVVDHLRSSAASLNIFCAYVRSRVLGSRPSLQDKWTALQIFSLLLHAEREPGAGRGGRSSGDMLGVQSILLNLITGHQDTDALVTDSVAETEGASFLTERFVKEQAARLLALARQHGKRGKATAATGAEALSS